MDHEVRSASRGRQPHSAPHSEMAEGGSAGRRRMEGDGDGHAAGRGNLAAAGERAPALRFRPVGGSMATERGARTSCCGPLRGRSGGGISVSGGSGAVLERLSGTVGEVRTGTSYGEDAPSGVRPVCGRNPAQAGREETGNIHVPRIYPPVWDQSEGPFRGLAQDGEQAGGGKAEADQADAAPPDARAARSDRGMAAERGPGLLSVPRSAGESPDDEHLSGTASQAVAATLRHRSQRRSDQWARIGPLFARWLPPPRTLHPYPGPRFDATHPR
jgi:hypothetical protein